MNDQVTPLGTVKFLKVSEVAATLRVSRMSVYRLIHAGDLEAVRFGRNFRVPQPAMDAYLRGAYYNAS
jgi:excisionase family DNA binding protein